MSRFEMLDPVEAKDGMEAWDLLLGGMTPAAVLSDLHMPRLNGLELLRKVRAHPGLTDLPFVLVTSASDVGTVKQAMGLGVEHYLVKPFDVESAECSVARAIGHAWMAAAEPPSATQQRLRIPGERLMVYLDSLAKQVRQLQSEVNDLPSAGALWPRIDTVNTGCLTLGLWHGSRIAKRIREESALHFDRTRVARELQEILDRVDDQVNNA
jgi:two-component system chemotaxis response regulator CheY